MLALGVREGEYIMIGDQIKVQVLSTGTLLRLGIEAPKEMKILRQNLYEFENPGVLNEHYAYALPQNKKNCNK